MSPPIRLTAVLTHPVQYYAPWFRHIAAGCPEIDLTVVYATRPTPAQQGVGFGAAFEWDPPLTAGYRHVVVRAPRPGDSVHSSRFWGLDVPAIGAAIAETRPDVAMIPGWHSATLLRALRACRRSRVPVLHRGDTHLGSRPAGWRRPLWALRTRLLLRMYDAYLCPGTRAREYLVHFGVPPGRIFDVPHSVDGAMFAGAAAEVEAPAARAADRRAFGLPPEHFVLAFVGKLDAHKRPLDALGAAARLRPPVSVLVVGSGDLESACRAEAERLGVNAVWTGFLNQSQVGRAYAVSDCLVVPSAGETWGLVMDEALAAGVPCVVSDRVGAAPDLIRPGTTGDVFPMGDVAALAAAIERVRARECAAGARGRAARQAAVAGSLERATAGVLDACRAVTRRRAPAVPSVRR